MIGILGGTFNPLHNGHILLAKGAAEQCGFEKVLLIPTNVPPHKAAPDLAPAEDRLELCRLAAEECGLFEVCDIEIRRQGRSYTSDTLEELTALHPGESFALIMGADMFFTLHQWVRWRDILRLAAICASPREGYQGDFEEYAEMLRAEGGRVLLPRLELPEISSTELRRRLADGGDVSGMIPERLLEYIRRNGLYVKNDG